LYADYEKLVREIPEDMDIGLLVNNAGLGNSGPFKDVDSISSLQNLVNVNALHPVYMTYAMLNLRFKARKFRSGVLNVSSVMGRTLMPAFQAYGATKRFLSYFSYIFATEAKMEGTNIDCLDYRPAFMATKLSGQTAGLFTSTPAASAKASLDAIHLSKVSNGLFIHHLSEYGMEWADWFIPSLYYKNFFKEGKKAWKAENGIA